MNKISDNLKYSASLTKKVLQTFQKKPELFSAFKKVFLYRKLWKKEKKTF